MIAARRTLLVLVLTLPALADEQAVTRTATTQPTTDTAGPPIDTSVLLLADAAVQADLRCRAGQKRAIRALLDEVDRPIWALRDVPPEQARDQLVPLLDKLARGIDSILLPFQRERFRQILLQRQGPDALLAPGLKDVLSLTDKQVTQLRVVLDDTRAKLDAIDKIPWKEKGPSQRRRETYEIRSHEQKLILAILTQEQQQTWIKPRGRRFDFAQLQPMPVRAPELQEAEKPEVWVNSKPLTLAGLRGQVVVVHFYTFSCGNCKHNYWAYKGWQKDYTSRGVTIVGIHTPEVKGDYDVARLRQSVKDNGLLFPVVVDNGKKNWDAWSNRVWPSVYLVDRQGYVRNWWYGELKGPKPDMDNEKFVRARIDALLAEAGPASQPGK